VLDFDTPAAFQGPGRKTTQPARFLLLTSLALYPA
jgi:hypothetical protein